MRRFEVPLADLLEISRFDAGAAELEALREDMNALVTQAVEDVRPLAGARGRLLDVRLGEGSTTAVVDARRVDRILRNLLTNAIEHGAGAPVLVQTAGDEDAVAVVVQDFGHGISPEDARRVFDRFWRADPSRARTLGGTGLGLSISVSDANLHGGWAQAWGQEGEGAVFRLTLPRRPGTELVRSPRGSSGPSTVPSPTPPSPRRRPGRSASAPTCCPISTAPTSTTPSRRTPQVGRRAKSPPPRSPRSRTPRPRRTREEHDEPRPPHRPARPRRRRPAGPRRGVRPHPRRLRDRQPHPLRRLPSRSALRARTAPGRRRDRAGGARGIRPGRRRLGGRLRGRPRLSHRGGERELGPGGPDHDLLRRPGAAGAGGERGTPGARAPGRRRGGRPRGPRRALAGPTPQELAVAVEEVEGQWRLSEVPDGIFLSEAAFETLYSPARLYFLDARERHLVPDHRWSPRAAAPRRCSKASSQDRRASSRGRWATRSPAAPASRTPRWRAAPTAPPRSRCLRRSRASPRNHDVWPCPSWSPRCARCAASPWCGSCRTGGSCRSRRTAAWSGRCRGTARSPPAPPA
ncbi:ATP-binding protein [Brachybacterium sp. GPGPB12]|uniref:ATP-binding protein n=1 Tax=Brachybacterium sp. GPGPB12 TaxID=3023517 RepID=UPI0031343D45